MGLSRAWAMAQRATAFCIALAAHWTLCYEIGGHIPLFGEALKAVRILKPEATTTEAEEALKQGNGARHAPPSEAAPALPLQPRAAKAAVLDEFRYNLFLEAQNHLDRDTTVTDGEGRDHAQARMGNILLAVVVGPAIAGMAADDTAANIGKTKPTLEEELNPTTEPKVGEEENTLADAEVEASLDATDGTGVTCGCGFSDGGGAGVQATRCAPFRADPDSPAA